MKSILKALSRKIGFCVKMVAVWEENGKWMWQISNINKTIYAIFLLVCVFCLYRQFVISSYLIWDLIALLVGSGWGLFFIKENWINNVECVPLICWIETKCNIRRVRNMPWCHFILTLIGYFILLTIPIPIFLFLCQSILLMFASPSVRINMHEIR